MAKREEIVEASADMYDPKKGLTVQDTMRQTDLSYQLRQLGGVQNLPVFATPGVYADVAEIGDFRSALEVIEAVRTAFMEQPPLLRERFGNDPARLLDFCSDPVNREEALRLGLVLPVGEPEVTLKDVVAAVKAGPPAVLPAKTP